MILNGLPGCVCAMCACVCCTIISFAIICCVKTYSLSLLYSISQLRQKCQERCPPTPPWKPPQIVRDIHTYISHIIIELSVVRTKGNSLFLFFCSSSGHGQSYHSAHNSICFTYNTIYIHHRIISRLVVSCVRTRILCLCRNCVSTAIIMSSASVYCIVYWLNI